MPLVVKLEPTSAGSQCVNGTVCVGAHSEVKSLHRHNVRLRIIGDTVALTRVCKNVFVNLKR